MRDGRVRRLPVVKDDGVLEGIVSMDDVVRNARSADGKMGSGISHGDAITTLQAIYGDDNQFRGRSAPRENVFESLQLWCRGNN